MHVHVILTYKISTSSNAGKKRSVVDRNRLLWKQKIQYEDLRVVMMLFEPGEWMVLSDLKLGYHNIDVAQKHHKYLGFSW